ncbi:MAG: type VI secretion system contractile sheath large subunit [Acetobacteraceae bacterium]|nr:type VI secretion system contractile sheath large subunit [Acetobacteraceae bacterium]
MNDSAPVIDEPAAQAVAAGDGVAAVPDKPDIRGAILSGSFLGARNYSLEDALIDFLAAEEEDALEIWLPPGWSTRNRREWQDYVRGLLDRDIAAIDVMLCEQLDAVLHHDRFRRLEGTWRGLAWLVGGMEHGARLKAKLLNVTWADICRDLERAVEFDQSHLFRKVYEEEFGMPGGEPYGLLIIDHDVRHRPGPNARTDDMGALSALSGIAAACFCPTILGASPALLEVDDFADLATVMDIAGPLRNPDHARWRSLTSRPDTRFLGVALPRLLARAPWEDDGTRADGFRYKEYAPDSNARVWMSAGYAFGQVVARAFAQSAWPGDIRGADQDRIGGGLVTEMPMEAFRTDPDMVWNRKSVEIIWNDRQERELLDAGLIPLAATPFADELVFGAARSPLIAQRFTGANAEAANANARLSTQINTILCASRFAHYLKMLGRQMVGSFKTPEEIEITLDEWIKKYVRSNAPYETRARYPLIAGKVTVYEHAGKPGSYGCTVQLQPHYQIDDVAASFQLVTDLGGR